jgi:polysaccharide pyruvyl transferase WcaK-like protein
LDVSGGDSFTDLYGERRFWEVTRPKLLALEMNRPLVLLPQTYGPFENPRIREVASRVVRGATRAWARDGASFRVLRDLAGDAFDAERHRCGVDLAFALPVRQPVWISPTISAWLRDRSKPLIGFNVSGLIWNRPLEASRRYKMRADYRRVVVAFLHRVVEETDARILLIPHVAELGGRGESDSIACEAVRAALQERAPGRAAVARDFTDPCEAKWLISKMDWFCGTRMHSTIAALSSGVPAAAIAYSIKTRGVFESCRQGEHVADPRKLNACEMIVRLWQSLNRRKSARGALAELLPGVRESASHQIREIVELCEQPPHTAKRYR